MPENPAPQSSLVTLLDPKQPTEGNVPKAWSSGRLRIGLVHHVSRIQGPHRRQRTASAKGRGEVRGGGRKPWRQKGTGRARQGSIRSPQWRKGGVVFGPKPRMRSLAVNRKERNGALGDVLWTRWNHGCLGLLDSSALSTIKTGQGADILRQTGWAGKTLVLTLPEEKKLRKAFRNLPYAILALSGSVRTDQVLQSAGILASPEAWKATVKDLDRAA